MSSVPRFQERGSQQSGRQRPPARLRGRRLPTNPRVPRPVSVSAIVRASHEPKNLDLTGNFSCSTTTGTLQCLNLIQQGSSGNNRTGRQVKLEHLRLNMFFQAANNEPNDLFRVIVFIDKESRGANPVVGDVLTNTTFGFGAILSSHNFDNVPTRFKILHDEVITPVATVSVSATNALWNEPIYHRLMHIPLSHLVHYYNTSAGTIADIDSGALFFLVYGAQSTNAGLVEFDSRMVFRDL
jgi:hypothetical protein